MIIWRYICKEASRALLATVAVLLLVLVTNQLVHYLNQASIGQLSVQAVIAVVILEIPTLLAFMLPLGVVLGLLITLGRLVADQEMIVLFAGGFSRRRLYSMVASMGLIMSLLVLWLTGFVAPACRSWQEGVLVNAIKATSLSKVIPGEFMSLGHGGRVLYAGQAASHSHLGNVFFASPQVSHANTAGWSLLLADDVSQQRHGTLAGAFLFNRGQHYTVPIDSNAWETMTFQRYDWRLERSKSSHSDSLAAWSLARLWRNRHTWTLSEAVEWQWRFAMPFAVLALAFMVVPLTQLSPRQGKFMRLLPAVMLYLIYANVLFLCKSWLLQGRYPLLIGLWWLPVLALSLVLVREFGKWLSWRLRRRGDS